MTEYYNVIDSGHKVLGFASTGLIGVVIGLTVLLFMFKLKIKGFKRGFMYFWTGFAVLWTLGAGISTASEYFKSVSALKNGDYQQVEGIVKNFDPMPHSGHKNESFTVSGVFFEYSDFGPSAGFNNTKSHGGPIDEGKYVKIRYKDGLILQLWVKK